MLGSTKEADILFVCLDRTGGVVLICVIYVVELTVEH